jgi:hypothetical protein
VNSCLPVRLLSLVLIALGATAISHATQVALVGDASVSTARPATNFGALSNLYVGNGNTALLQFDLSTLPAGTTAAQIAHATLTVFVNRVNANGSVSLSPITSAWTESAVTATTIPTLGAVANAFPTSAAGQFVTLDVTALVQASVTTPATNFGFALSSANANLLLDSKENDETGHAATLDITITSEGATGSQGLLGPQGPVGPIGLQGLLGPQGPVGPIGPQGLLGIPGIAGTNGTSGTAGAAGAAGAPGPFVGGNYSAAVDYPAGSVVENASSTYLAVQTNGPSTTVVTPGSNSAYWVATTGINSLTPASYFDETTTEQGFEIPSGEPVFLFGFPISSTNSGFLLFPPGESVVVEAAGIYTYDYSVSISSGLPGALSLTDNGILIPNTTFGSQSGMSQIVGHGVITLNAGDRVELIVAASSEPLRLQFSTPGQNVAAFSLVAMAAGTPGAAGATGAIGPAGPAGTNGTNGAQGPTGPTGLIGLTGATGTLGAVTNWSSSTAYQIGQVVFCATNCATNGSSYIALVVPNQATDPSISNGTWQLIAEAGAIGPAGAAGTNGTDGAQGPAGSAGTAGTAGAAGATGATGTLGAVTNWSSSTTYQIGQVVFCSSNCATNGSSYFALLGPNQATDPSISNGTWQLIAEAGAIGAAGAAGTNGPEGPTGPTGAAGATGAASGVLDFADFFALMPPDNAATVAPGTDVSFPEDGPASGLGLIARTGPSSINLSAIGTYQVLFQVSVDEAGQLILTLNGADLAYTVVGRATGTSQIVGMALVSTTVLNSLLTVRNPAGNSTALTITPLAGGVRDVSAHLVITRIQ